jgi:hypothetical protein
MTSLRWDLKSSRHCYRISGIHYPSPTTTGSSPNLLEASTSGGRHGGRPDSDSGDDDEDKPAEKEKKGAEDEARNVVVGPRGINRINRELRFSSFLEINVFFCFYT